MQCPPQCERCYTLWREQTLKKRQEVYTLQHCWTGPSSLLNEEEKKLEVPYGTDRQDWESRDQLFITRLFPELSKEAIQALATTSQQLVEGVQWSTET